MPDFPPLFDGRAVAEDPFRQTIAAARAGCDAGLLLYRPSEARIDAALALAPEAPLADAAIAWLIADLGFCDAFGALAPPEIGLAFDWPGGLRVEGARCGGVRVAAPPCGTGEIPPWLVVGLEVDVARNAAGEPGHTPDVTDLHAEGATIAADDLLAAWARHTLSWIARWEDEGAAPVHRAWLGRAWSVGKPVELTVGGETRRGNFKGLDERGGMLLKGDAGTRLIPLAEMLERP